MEWVLRDDALSVAEDGGLLLRVGLPWMRSLPLSCVVALDVTIDGEPVADADVRICLAADRVTVDELAQRDSWWFLQDRLVLALPATSAGSGASGDHEVVVAMRLLLPYLNAGPNQPAILPFRAAATLAPAPASAAAPADRHTVSLDVR